MKSRKRRQDRNHVIYVIRNLKNGQEYIGLTAVNYNGSVQRTIVRRMQKHIQRALAEDKDWGLCRAIRRFGPEQFSIRALEIVRGKKPAHARETELINTLKPKLNTFGAK